MDINQLQRKLKVEHVGEEGTWVEICGSPKLEFNQDAEATGKILIPITMGGKKVFDFKANSDSVDAIAEKLGSETADWLHAEIFILPTSAMFGKERVTWLVAKDARTTERQLKRNENLRLDAQNSRLG